MEEDVSGDEFQGLKLKNMIWTWKNGRRETRVSCFNEHRPESTVEDLDHDRPPMKRMDVMTIVVNEANQLPAALDIFKKAMELAPGQERKVRVSDQCRDGTLKPYCSVDAEFVKLLRARLLGMDRRQQQSLVDSGEAEEICSVLSIAIGRHFVLIFNVIQIMEHPDEQTVPALHQLFSEVIFDERICKLWWDLQSDFTVMNNTIAISTKAHRECHSNARRMQGAHTPSRRQPGSCRVSFSMASVPRMCCWLLRRSLASSTPKGYVLDNVDIVAQSLLRYFCRLHGLRIGAMHLTKHMDHFRYEDFLDSMLLHRTRERRSALEEAYQLTWRARMWWHEQRLCLFNSIKGSGTFAHAGRSGGPWRDAFTSVSCVDEQDHASW